MIIVIPLLILFLTMGIYFLVKSKKDSSNKGFYEWIGISLIVMVIFFVLLSSYQFIAPDDHIGH
ncbi:hypothetical protein [Paenibacillus sp. An7]|uniref:hypothetical protein n=1 Tax=Paenibacillus sp. An7 TaxID=2689577 RepID=UPI00135BEA10|nr:hypothetical protein [Paenibacillus sp. An7]